MTSYNTSHYKINYSRYQHYYRQIWRFYEKPSAKISVALILTIITIIFFAVFAIRPTLVTIAELLKTIHDRQEVLVKLEEKSTNLAKAQQVYLESSDITSALANAIPEDQAVQDLITSIEATAAKNQLVLDAVNISEFNYSNEPTSSNEPISLPLTISISGEYAALQAFLTDIIHLPRFTTVNSMSINSGTDQDQLGDSTSTLNLDIQLTAYYQQSEIEY